MRDHLAQAAKFFGGVLCVPFIVGLIGEWNDGLGFILFLFGAPVLAIAFIGGGLIFVARGATLSDVEPAWHRVAAALAAPAMILAVLILVWPSLDAGRHFGSLSRLIVNRSKYEAIIARSQSSKPDETGAYLEQQGITYIVDAGPPVRVAFNPAGFLDNWSGIVFDPSGEVMQADGFDPGTGKFRATDGVTKLFGGDLVACRHLLWEYYSCAFT